MLKENELKKIQAKINYQFQNTKLLQQAFTRKSYSTALGGSNNEILEFFGDRVLDYAVMKDFYDRFGMIDCKNEFLSSKPLGDLSKAEIAIIKNSNLSEQITRMGLKKYMQVISSAEKCNLKNKADLLEAILGAVAIDSNWNIESILKVYHKMLLSCKTANLFFDDNINDYTDTFDTLVWKHRICKTKFQVVEESDIYLCSFVIIINGKACEIHGSGKTRKEAISAACEFGAKLILLVLEKEIIQDESYTNQLYLLYKNGFCSEPQFHFEYFPKNSSNNQDLWRCYGSFPENENEFLTEDIHMADAKEQAAYAMLCEILGIDYEQEESCDNSINQNYVAINPEYIIRGQGLLKHILSMYQNVA